MRIALSGLTIRGRCFVAAGTASCLCALFLGEVDLLRVGLFVLVLPLAAVGAVARTRYRLTCTRRLDPTRVTVGREARVQLQLENVSRMPTGLMLVEDRLPYALGRRPRFVLDRLESRGVRRLDYRIRADTRGRYRLGPLAVRLTDPFGLVELVRSFASEDTLVVTPEVLTLAPVRLAGGTSGFGDAHARVIAAAGEDDAATREYRHGDDLRRVHWRSTAHYGELMVRREEQYWQSRASLLLDTRRLAHRGDGPGSSFEWSVSATASIGVHLARQRYELRFVTDAGQPIAGESGTGGFVEGALLDTLAVVTPSRNRSLRDAVSTLRQDRDEHLLIAVLGVIGEEEAEQLARLTPAGGAVRVAVLVDTASWAARTPGGRQRASDAQQAGRTLQRAGWTVLVARPGDRVDTVWSHLGTQAPAIFAGTGAAAEGSAR